MPTTVQVRLRTSVMVRLKNDEHARLIFTKYEPSAKAIATQMSRKYGRSRAELTDLALEHLSEIAMKARDEHDPAIATLFTWLYGQIQWKLVNHCLFERRRWKRHHGVHVEQTEEPIAPRGRLLERLLSELSEEARALVQIVVEVPGELSWVFRHAPSDASAARAGLLQYLQRAGVDDDVIDSAWTEVQEALASETLAVA